MNIAEIISIIASIAAMISAIAACITCFLHYRFTKPKIKVRIHQQPQECTFTYSTIVNKGQVRMGYMVVSIHNSSSVGGTIGAIELLYKKNKYSVETIYSNYQPWFKINFTSAQQQDSDAFRLRTPLVVPAYSAIMGYFLFPDFPIVNEKEIFVTIRLKIIGNNLNTRHIKNVRFEEFIRTINTYQDKHCYQTPNTYNYSDNIYNNKDDANSAHSSYSFIIDESNKN